MKQSLRERTDSLKRAWNKNNRLVIASNKQAIYKKEPWRRQRAYIISRCCKDGVYTKKNIKNKLSVKQLKYLWFRDNAFLMKIPSIDRIDSKGDYDIKNCRFIELRENTGKTVKPIFRYSLDGKFLERYESITCASHKIGVGISSISLVLNGKQGRKTSGGFKWKFANEAIDQMEKRVDETT